MDHPITADRQLLEKDNIIALLSSMLLHTCIIYSLGLSIDI